MLYNWCSYIHIQLKIGDFGLDMGSLILGISKTDEMFSNVALSKRYLAFAIKLIAVVN